MHKVLVIVRRNWRSDAKQNTTRQCYMQNRSL